VFPMSPTLPSSLPGISRQPASAERPGNPSRLRRGVAGHPEKKEEIVLQGRACRRCPWLDSPAGGLACAGIVPTGVRVSSTFDREPSFAYTRSVSDWVLVLFRLRKGCAPAFLGDIPPCT
jgi:hypothetical protein